VSEGPDHTSAERWLFECLRAGEGDRAIAERMGLEPEQVTRWIASLVDELDAHSREGLVALAIAEAPARSLGRAEPPPKQPVSHTRRAVIAGGVVAAAAGAYGAFRVSQGVDLGAAPGPTATPEPTPTPGPTNTPAPLDVIQQIQAVPVQRTEFAPGQVIDVPGGIGFLDTGDGSATVWQAVGLSRGGPGIDLLYRPLDDELDLVHVLNLSGFSSRPPDAVLQLSRDRGWTWQTNQIEFAGYSSPYLLLRERISGRPALHHVLEIEDGGLRLVTTLDLFDADTPDEEAYLGQIAAFADDRRLYQLRFRDGRPELAVIELPAGSRRTLLEMEPPESNASPRILKFEPAGDGVAIDIAWYIYTPDTATPLEATRYRVSGDGSVRTEQLPTPADGRLSPNGRYVLRDEPLRNIPSMQGVGESFPALVVSDRATGQPLFRLRSAMVGYGRSSSFVAGPEGLARWLADSSGFVARISAAETLEARDVIFAPDGSLLEVLPSPPEVVNEGRNRYAHGFVPAPDNPALLSWSGVAVYNRQEGTWLALHPAEDAGGSNSDPWLQSGDRMVFSFGRGSFGSNSSNEQGVFLEPLIEYPPFVEGDEALSFEVAGPEPAVLWSRLTNAREEVATLPPGAPLAILDRPQGEVSPGRRATGFYNSEMHVSVRTADGLEGWVATTDLRWA
jgi:hypothetical protein